MSRDTTNFTTDTRVSCDEKDSGGSGFFDSIYSYYMNGDSHEYILVVTNPSSYYRESFSFRAAVTNLEIHVWSPALAKFVILNPDKVSAMCDGQVLDPKNLKYKKCEIIVHHPIVELQTTFFKIITNNDLPELKIDSSNNTDATTISN